jgi:hypothetical protein
MEKRSKGRRGSMKPEHAHLVHLASLFTCGACEAGVSGATALTANAAMSASRNCEWVRLETWGGAAVGW